MQPVGYVMTDAVGKDSLYLELATAMNAVQRMHGGVIEAVLRESVVRQMLEAAFKAGECAARAAIQIGNLQESER